MPIAEDVFWFIFFSRVRGILFYFIFCVEKFSMRWFPPFHIAGPDVEREEVFVVGKMLYLLHKAIIIFRPRFILLKIVFIVLNNCN